jgi:hypothetical protein
MTNASTQTPNPAQTGTSNNNLTIRDNPFEWREYNGIVFRSRQDRNFFIGRLSRSQRNEWLRDYPDRWQTREDFFRERQARAGTNVEANATRARSTTSAASPLPVAQAIAYTPTKAEDERQPDNPVTAPQTIANPEGTNPETPNARDEIIIDGRRLLGEHRVAEMLARTVRSLQRWRTEGRGPPSTKIGRKVYYDLNDLQEWIDRGKNR